MAPGVARTPEKHWNWLFPNWSTNEIAMLRHAAECFVGSPLHGGSIADFWRIRHRSVGCAERIVGVRCRRTGIRRNLNSRRAGGPALVGWPGGVAGGGASRRALRLTRAREIIYRHRRLFTTR